MKPGNCINIDVIISLFLLFSYASNLSKDNLTPISTITPASGYSSLSKTISQEKCYKPIIISPSSSQTSEMYFDSYLSFKELMQKIKIDRGEYDLDFYFSNSTLYQFLRHAENTFNSFSFSYLRRISTLIGMVYNKREYNDKDEEYYVKCGDSFLSSYEIGFLLIYNVKVNFKTPKDRNKFVQYFEEDQTKEISFVSILSSIQNVLLKETIEAKIEISSIQLGGNSQLVNYGDNEGYPFYLKRCSGLYIFRCKIIINNLASYMMNEINEEFPYENKRYYQTKTFVPLLNYAIGEKIYDFPESQLREKEQSTLFYLYERFYKYYTFLSDLSTNYYGKIDDVEYLIDSINKLMSQYKMRYLEFFSKDTFRYSRIVEGEVEDDLKQFFENWKKQFYIHLPLKENFCLSPQQNNTNKTDSLLKWDNSKNDFIRIYLYKNIIKKNKIRVNAHAKSESFFCKILSATFIEKGNFVIECSDNILHFNLTVSNFTKVSCTETSLGMNNQYESNSFLLTGDNPFQYPSNI